MRTRKQSRLFRHMLVLLLAGLCLHACNAEPKVTDKNVTIIDDVELAELLQSSEGVVIVDARPDYRYRLGHLPGAINIPLPELKPEDARLTASKHIVVYGDGPSNSLSHAAAKKLLASGHLVVSDFRGGYELWTKAGRETVRGN